METVDWTFWFGFLLLQTFVVVAAFYAGWATRKIYDRHDDFGGIG